MPAHASRRMVYQAMREYMQSREAALPISEILDVLSDVISDEYADYASHVVQYAMDAREAARIGNAADRFISRLIQTVSKASVAAARLESELQG